MDSFNAMEISASALTAERRRMNLISNNLANANSTRTAEGGPYKRKDAVFAAVSAPGSFAEAMGRARGREPQKVEVMEIVEDQNPPRMQYDPTHPDADPKGYVAYPNVNVVEEMADMMAATRAYEANVTASKAAMSMEMKALELLK
ncbi:flagellar basal body rod protein FlgC [Geobacter sp. DSM 9736]|uniref:flagellar basal body rod protein FlgC n=1 Tax=Geobacter sp. DSM 9736 TaxID=1277350 RepID=UPI000B50BDE8|nr:flagellar basal body rod protein FlgC [Geobacter sp. DSM 9736]SNB45376.1 flagellar basal-body rod protein FlgC [Geobacter sp. DSM 9736]